MPLALAVVGIATLFALNRSRVATIFPYMLVGVFLWFCFYYSGIHTTLAGVIVGLSIPIRDADDARHSPLNKLMHFLHPWVGFLVLPIFAFTSAGGGCKDLSSPILLSHCHSVLPDYFFGKQIGIFGTSFLLIKSKLVSMPKQRGGDIYMPFRWWRGLASPWAYLSECSHSLPHISHEMVKIGVIVALCFVSCGVQLCLKFATMWHYEFYK